MQIKIKSVELPQISTKTFLGVLVDERLGWKGFVLVNSLSDLGVEIYGIAFLIWQVNVFI